MAAQLYETVVASVVERTAGAQAAVLETVEITVELLTPIISDIMTQANLFFYPLIVPLLPYLEELRSVSWQLYGEFYRDNGPELHISKCLRVGNYEPSSRE